MSILRSLNIGVSGLRANSDGLNVAGDNIANVNTVGFKRSRGVFEDMLGHSIASSGPTQEAGAGSRMAHVEQLFSEGALVTTDSPTDLAISGDGFFAVKGNLQGAQGQYYTRAGQFHVDANGFLVNPDNLRLQGYSAQPNGTIGATVGDLNVTPGTVPANATTAINVGANLDANATIPAAFDPANPGGTSNYSNNVTVYDSLGNQHEVTIYYRKSAPNAWEWHAMVDGGELTGGTAGVPTEGANGTMTYTTNGALDTEATAASSWNFANATQAQAITFDFGTSITTDGGTGLDGSTQFASPSSTTALTQDGYAAGNVSGISIGGDGKILGTFSNGQQRILGQVVLAKFANDNGLERGGQGLWFQTQASGEPLLGAADSGGKGAIVAGALEQSNVDMGTEFVNLISYQRGFQANSRVITTADEMYGELVNIKR
jgi:flagellar hook protein FlgE